MSTKFNTIQRRGRRGSIMLLGTVSMVLLFSFMGLALDASYMYFYKRKMQTAADAGAYAGALEKLRGNAAAITEAAQSDTSANGFNHGSSGVVVAVNSPPLGGVKVGNANFVEVVINQPQPTWFMRVLNFNSVNIQARGVAGIGNTSNGCVYALNRDTGHQNNGFFVNGTTDSSFACAVYSNANFRSVGGACVQTPSVNFTGDYSNQNSDGNCGPRGITRGVPVVDPLKDKFSIPNYSGCNHNNFRVNTGTTVSLLPGVYCGGITISGSVENVVLSAGQYILAGGGLKVTSNANVTGSSVTIFNTYPGSQVNRYDGISINGSGTVSLAAPTSGAYEGLLFFQDPRVSWSANNGSSIAGGPNSTFNGIFYFPTTDLTYAGNSSTNGLGTDGYTMLVGYNIKVAGTARVNLNFSALANGNPFKQVLFVE